MKSYLEEFYGITLRISDANTMDFVNDLLMQNFIDNPHFKYDGQDLVLAEIERTTDKNIKVILRKNIKKTKKTRQPYGTGKFRDKIIIVEGYMPEFTQKQYKLSPGDEFDNVDKLCEHCGLHFTTMYRWLDNKWITTRDKAVKTPLPVQENRGYISEDGRKRISEARSKEYNERLEGEIIVTDKLPEKLQKKYNITPEDVFMNCEELMNRINKSKKTVDNWRKGGWIEFVK